MNDTFADYQVLMDGALRLHTARVPADFAGDALNPLAIGQAVDPISSYRTFKFPLPGDFVQGSDKAKVMMQLKLRSMAEQSELGCLVNTEPTLPVSVETLLTIGYDWKLRENHALELYRHFDPSPIRSYYFFVDGRKFLPAQENHITLIVGATGASDGEMRTYVGGHGDIIIEDVMLWYQRSLYSNS